MVKSSRFIATFAAAAAALATVGAAGATAPPASKPAPSESATADAAAASGPATAADAAWDKVVLGGDCACADGSEFAIWERRAEPTKVVFYLDGGGACWDTRTCAFTGNGDSGMYEWNIADDDPAREGGIFNLSNPDNPLADYSFVYVPLCTGDVHLGDVTREYSPELTVEHNGFVNGTAALSYLAEHYPDTAQVVVVGVSPGSVAAPVYAGLMSDALPDAQITVIGDSSGVYPDDAAVSKVLERWGAFETMPDWEVNEGLTAEDWSFPRLWMQAGLHDPEIVMARFDFAFDEVQAQWVEILSMTGVDPSNLVAAIDANDAAIEEAGVVQHSYIAPGTDHAIVGDNLFYRMQVGDVTLDDWVDALIAGEPLPDVHCEQCETA